MQEVRGAPVPPDDGVTDLDPGYDVYGSPDAGPARLVRWARDGGGTRVVVLAYGERYAPDRPWFDVASHRPPSGGATGRGGGASRRLATVVDLGDELRGVVEELAARGLAPADGSDAATSESEAVLVVDGVPHRVPVRSAAGVGVAAVEGEDGVTVVLTWSGAGGAAPALTRLERPVPVHRVGLVAPS